MAVHQPTSSPSPSSTDCRPRRLPVWLRSSTNCAICWCNLEMSSTQIVSSSAASSLCPCRLDVNTRRPDLNAGSSRSAAVRRQANAEHGSCQQPPSPRYRSHVILKLIRQVMVHWSHGVSDHDLVTWSLAASESPPRQVRSYSFRNLKAVDLELFKDDVVQRCSLTLRAPLTTLPISWTTPWPALWTFTVRFSDCFHQVATGSSVTAHSWWGRQTD